MAHLMLWIRTVDSGSTKNKSLFQVFTVDLLDCQTLRTLCKFRAQSIYLCEGRHPEKFEKLQVFDAVLRCILTGEYMAHVVAQGSSRQLPACRVMLGHLDFFTMRCMKDC